MMRVYSFFLLLSLLSFEVFSLALDEKLPLRILRVSGSKKTILINRGLEDGLVKGDHAKFFLTKGVVARGVVIKASPTRTVWSLYRVIESGEVKVNRVMNLKIASPVKLTEDPTKMISNEDLPEYNRRMLRYYEDSTVPYYQGRVAPVYKGEPVPKYYNKGVPVAKRPDDEQLSEEFEQMEEVEEQEEGQVASAPVEEEIRLEEDTYSPRVANNRKWEFFSNLALNALSSEVDTSDGDTDNFSGSLSALDFTLGVERYFFPATSFWSRFSLGSYYHMASQENTTFNGIATTTSVTEFGLYTNYYFGSPARIEKPTFYLNLTMGFGSSSDTFENNSSVSTGTLETTADSSGNTFSAMGIGMKYLTKSYFGANMILDYYSRTESFTHNNAAGTEVETDRTVTGPRFLVGFFYRW